uniref:Uncharacterized protein n=1 Tax=Arundo donax TaxID=35708 RepID=A0A0A8ZIU1_ARUDO
MPCLLFTIFSAYPLSTLHASDFINLEDDRCGRVLINH